MVTQITYLNSLQELANQAQSQIDKLMPHMGEKGRLAEEIIKNILIDILPDRFSIGTGVIISSDGLSSNQIDIIIYDRINNAPLLNQYSANVFPIECVYAFIEVKTTIDNNELLKSIKSINTIRKISRNKKFIKQIHVLSNDKDLVTKFLPVTSTTAPRGYIVAFKRRGISNNFDTFKNKIGKICDQKSTHIHGICILKDDWFVGMKANVPNKNSNNIVGFKNHSLANLYKAILQQQQNFEVLPADIAAYLPN